MGHPPTCSFHSYWSSFAWLDIFQFNCHLRHCSKGNTCSPLVPFHIPYMYCSVFGGESNINCPAAVYVSGLTRDLGVYEVTLQRCWSLSIVLHDLTSQGQVTLPVWAYIWPRLFIIPSRKLCSSHLFQANPSFQLTSILMAQNLQPVVKVSLFFCLCHAVMPRILIGVMSFIFNLFLNISGEDSGKVMIWNMAPVLREEDEKNENVPKMLCQMDNHLGNCAVLFSIFGVVRLCFFFFLNINICCKKNNTTPLQCRFQPGLLVDYRLQCNINQCFALLDL